MKVGEIDGVPIRDEWYDFQWNRLIKPFDDEHYVYIPYEDHDTGEPFYLRIDKKLFQMRGVSDDKH